MKQPSIVALASPRFASGEAGDPLRPAWAAARGCVPELPPDHHHACEMEDVCKLTKIYLGYVVDGRINLTWKLGI